MRVSLFLYSAVLFFSTSILVRAEGVDEALRYDSFTMDGVLHRFDKKTGALEKLAKVESGLAWTKVEVQISSVTPAAKSPLSTTSDNAHLNEMGHMQQPSEDRIVKGTAASFRFFDEQDNDITDAVTDADRKGSLQAITSYENKLSLSHTVQIGDKITGNILVKNLGDKRLRVLELTMQVPVIGREKHEEHRFLFIDKVGAVNPPQPGSGGKEACALLQKVDFQSPAGGVKGSPDLRVSYIRFAE